MTWYDDFESEYGDKPHNEAWDPVSPERGKKWDELLDPDNVLRQAVNCSKKSCRVKIGRGFHRLAVVVTRTVDKALIIDTPQSFCSICTPITEFLRLELITREEWQLPMDVRAQLYRLSGVEERKWCDWCRTEIPVTEDRTTVGIHEIDSNASHWRVTKVFHFHPGCAPDAIFNPVLNDALFEQLQIHQEKLNEKVEPADKDIEIARLKKQQKQDQRLQQEGRSQNPLRIAGIRNAAGRNRDDFRTPHFGDSDIETNKLTARRNRARMLVNSGEVTDEFEQRILHLWGNERMSEADIAREMNTSRWKISQIIQLYAPEHEDRPEPPPPTPPVDVVKARREWLFCKFGQRAAENFDALSPEQQQQAAQEAMKKGWKP